MTWKAIVFDLDGTLLDSLADLADAMNRVLESRGFPVHPLEAYRSFVGSGATALVTRTVPEARRTVELITSCTEQFRAEYGSRWREKTRLYDGVADLLDGLVERGLAMSVLSNKPDEATQRCVKHFLGRWDFASVMGVRGAILPKPDLTGIRETTRILGAPPAETLYVGDTGVDMDTAVGAGMHAVGALWGFRSGEELSQHGAATLIAKPTDLLRLLL